MKYSPLLLLMVVLSCQEVQDPQSVALDRKNIETTIRNLHISLKRAYTVKDLDTDSLLDVYYDSGSYYVTPWATSETIDFTKSRLREALAHVSDYDYSIESLETMSYGAGGTAFYVLRQDYSVDGSERHEYLPTTLILEKREGLWKIVHAHRSADPETWEQWFPRRP